MGHGEECGGFLQAEGSVRLGSGVTGSGGQQTGEPLQQIGQFGFRAAAVASSVAPVTVT